MVKPGSWVRLPNTALRPRKKIVGASTPGIAAPGTRKISFAERRMSAPMTPRSAPEPKRETGTERASMLNPPSAAGGEVPWR